MDKVRKTQLDEKRDFYPQFMKIVDLISEQNPLQCRRVQSFILGQDKDYWSFAEYLCSVLNNTLINEKYKRREIAKAYNGLCMEILREQIKFRKTGSYPKKDVDSVKNEIYDKPDVMYSYMMGLLFTQLLWPNHYQLFRFFQGIIATVKSRSYLEIGAGHGMFTLELLRHFPHNSAVICDISKTSIEITKQILMSFGIDLSHIQFIHGDFFQTSFDKRSFDFITLGEVLEHVQHPTEMMLRLRNFLLPEGTVYISTCANCPASDHLYHFHSVDEIRTLLIDAGFLIADEIFLPAENIPVNFWQRELVTINYAAKLLKA